MRYIILVLLTASLILGLKIYNTTLSTDIHFATGELQILKSGGEKVNVKIQIADTINERARGLMFVKKMKEDEGMLFIFEEEQARKMWMENTYLPLDMLFVNKEKDILNFKENAKPMNRDIIFSVVPAMYVVELNAGFIKKHGIAKGDKIEFKIN